MDFNPRVTTGIPTEPVGSIPRPLKLQQAYAAYDAKKIDKKQLEEEQNAAVADTLKRFEATGSPIITDGEQRVSSFATYPIADTLAGSGLAPNLGPGGQYFAIFADGPSTTVCPAQRYIRSWAKRTLCRHRRSVEIDPTRTCTSNEGRSRSILRRHDIKVPLRPYLTKRELPHDCANQ